MGDRQSLRARSTAMTSAWAPRAARLYSFCTETTGTIFRAELDLLDRDVGEANVSDLPLCP